LTLLALPLLRPLLHRLLDVSGHDDLMVLCGLLLALVAGGIGFESVGLSSELGALVAGALLAGHGRASELSHALWSLKEVFLVGFFLNIGMSGLPDPQSLGLAALLLLLLPLKAVLFFFLLLRFKLRARSSFLTGLSLASYSEFGLIMAAVVLPEWLVPLAVAVALSFVVAAPLNRIAHGLYERLETRLVPFELDQRHPDEQPVSLGLAQILIMGMGRTGSAAYDFLGARQQRLVGLDSDPGRVQEQIKAGRRVLYADAEDPSFWHGVNLEHVKAVILCMNDPEAKSIATRQLRAHGFGGLIVANSLYEDEARLITAAGADHAYLAFSEAGVGLAEHVWEALYDNPAGAPRPAPG
ncbi:MAG: cation:proton antiporter family protein, partial [Candidatus Competibacterales bacterium]|nr:cation:proton antiporter family protein [Candidatus Competibacterales bacterium]